MSIYFIIRLPTVYVDRKVTVEVGVVKIVNKMKKTFYECDFNGHVENLASTDLCIKGTLNVLIKHPN